MERILQDARMEWEAEAEQLQTERRIRGEGERGGIVTGSVRVKAAARGSGATEDRAACHAPQGRRRGTRYVGAAARGSGATEGGAASRPRRELTICIEDV